MPGRENKVWAGWIKPMKKRKQKIKKKFFIVFLFVCFPWL